MKMTLTKEALCRIIREEIGDFKKRQTYDARKYSLEEDTANEFFQEGDVVAFRGEDEYYRIRKSVLRRLVKRCFNSNEHEHI